MCDEESFVTNNYMAKKILEEIKDTDYRRSLTDREIMDYLMPVTYNNERNAGWLSAGIRDVGGLVKTLTQILEN